MYSNNPGQPICYKVEIIGHKIEYGVSSSSTPVSSKKDIIDFNPNSCSTSVSFEERTSGCSIGGSSVSRSNDLDILATFYFKTKEEAVAKVSPLKWISCSHILFIPIYGNIVAPSPEIRIKDALCLRMIVAPDKNSHTFEEVKITPDTFFYRRVCIPVADWYYASFIF